MPSESSLFEAAGPWRQLICHVVKILGRKRKASRKSLPSPWVSSQVVYSSWPFRRMSLSPQGCSVGPIRNLRGCGELSECGCHRDARYTLVWRFPGRWALRPGTPRMLRTHLDMVSILFPWVCFDDVSLRHTVLDHEVGRLALLGRKRA